MALVPFDEERQLAMTAELPEEPIQAVTRFDMTSTKRALGSTMGQKTTRKLLRPLDRTATLSKLLNRTQKREEREAAAQEGGPSEQDVNRQALKDFFFALQVCVHNLNLVESLTCLTCMLFLPVCRATARGRRTTTGRAEKGRHT